MELFELLAARRSVRQYTEEPVSRKALEKIVAAGLMAPSSKNLHSTELLVVEDRSVVKAMARCKPHFAQMLEQAPAAIVVMGRLDSHAWVEDASAALMAMMLQATELGLGSCWVQVRHMTAEKRGADGQCLSSHQYLAELLELPEEVEVEAILALGHGVKKQRPRTLEEARPERVHWGKF